MFAMGGVRVEISKLAKFLTISDSDFEWDGFLRLHMQSRHTTVQLTPQGLLDLASRDHWIYIKGGQIDAKSKADVIQKALVLLQVSWMATTCITRRVYGLPLTLLEIHTMVHVVCAITLYIFWLKVRIPPRLRSKRF